MKTGAEGIGMTGRAPGAPPAILIEEGGGNDSHCPWHQAG